MKRNLIYFFISLLLTACSHLNRSPESGYSNRNNNSNTFYEHSEMPELSLQSQKFIAEIGLSLEDLKTEDGRIKFIEQQEIRKRELQLVDEREKRQYFQNITWFKNSHEQLQFLKQNGYYSRQNWLRKNGIGKRAVEMDKETEDLIVSKDIALGMPSEFVKKSWGNPDSIEVAGNSIYGNQRWRYKRFTPSTDGYRLQSRVVYFEEGKVAGWEQIDH